MINKSRISFTVNPTIIGAIDDERGDISRSKYIERILERHLKQIY
jgi:hypothetical protein